MKGVGGRLVQVWAKKQLCLIVGWGAVMVQRKKPGSDKYRGGAPLITCLVGDGAEILNSQD